MKLTRDEIRVRRREYFRRYYRENREKILARAKTPEAYAKNKLSGRRWREKNKDKIRENKRRYYQEHKDGWTYKTPADRPRPDRCDVCGDKRKIAFDHCHQRGIFRGWLCYPCNAALGNVRDDPNRLRKLIAYLERTKDVVPRQFSLPV